LGKAVNRTRSRTMFAERAPRRLDSGEVVFQCSDHCDRLHVQVWRADE
jgi:hypothetical protein